MPYIWWIHGKEIGNFYKHNKFNDTNDATDIYDIALVKLKKPIVMDERVNTICLPLKHNQQ